MPLTAGSIDRQLLRRVAYGLSAAVVCFALAGFLLLPPLLKSLLVKELSARLQRTVAIGKVAINPFSLTVDLENIRVSERGAAGQDFFSCARLHLNLEAVSLLKRGLIIREVRVVNPWIRIDRDGETHYNISDLFEKKTAGGPAESGGLRFSLNNIEILNGGIDFRDGPKQKDHKVRELNLSIPFLSNFPYYLDSYVKPSFAAKVNDRQVTLLGVTKPFKDSLETSININLSELDLPYYLAYLPFEPEFRLTSALLSTRLVFVFMQNSNGPPAITLSGDIDLTSLKVTDRAGALLTAVPAVHLAVKSADLTTRSVHLTRLGIESPEVNIIRRKDKGLNTAILNPPGPASPGESKPSVAPGIALAIDELRLAGGRLLFTDLSTPVIFKTHLEPVDIALDHFSTGKDALTALTFSATTEAGEAVKVTGDLSVDPLTVAGRAEVSRVPLKKYSPYYAERLQFSVEDALLDLAAGYRLAFKADAPEPMILLSDIGASLRSLKLRRPGEKEAFLLVPELTVSGGSVDMGQRELVFEKITSRSGALSVTRAADGTLDLLNLLAPEPVAAPSRAPSGKDLRPAKAWQYTLKSLKVENYALKYFDMVPADPVALSAGRIMLTAGRLSNRAGSTGTVSLSLLTGRKGSVSASGTLALNPLSARLRVSVSSVELYPLQAYVTEQTNVIITDGALSAAGTLSVSRAVEEGPLQAGYKGDVSVSGFRTVDSINTDELLSWGSLSVNGLDAGYNPLHWHIGEIAVSDYYARIIINPSGSLNLQEVLKPPQSPAGPAAGEIPPRATAGPDAASGTDITPAGIDRITLQGGTVLFEDFYIKPNYSARLVELGGRISGLSSRESSLGDLDLRGKLDNYAPLEITGKLNPLRSDLFVDLKAAVRDVDLSPVTPYSGRYAGYSIQKGKLSVDMTYHILKRKLEAEHRIFIDQLTFGDRVESPDATKLPVKLAVALLKNRKGEISLELPVSGYIDDPKFSVGRIVLKIILNLLVKAATSPFALLGAVFGGGGEELSFVEYDPGSAALSPQATAKLDTLIKALHDRPALKLELEGHVDPEKDREGLLRAAFLRKLKAQKLRNLVRQGQPAPELEKLTIDEAEYQVYLKAAYKEEKFPKPRNIIGIAKELPAPEMEKLILTHLEIRESDLRQLARQRALRVEEYLLQSKLIEPGRVFLVEAATLQPQKNEKMKESRVDFRLK